MWGEYPMSLRRLVPLWVDVLAEIMPRSATPGIDDDGIPVVSIAEARARLTRGK